jgi:CubicO group peptidase (beta-lactamase class C family)
MNRFKKIVAGLLLLILGYLVYYCWNAFPVLAGYSAKMACSCMYLGDRTLASVKEQELGKFPLKLAAVEVQSDSSIVASVLGMAKQTAVYRPGLGCTLVNELSKAALKKQAWHLAVTPAINPDTIDWPMGDRIPVLKTDSQMAQPAELLLPQAVQAAFMNPKEDQPVRTRAVLVVHKGRLLAEQYAPGFDRHHRQLSWSMAKSITGTLVGMLVKEGKLSLDQAPPVAAWKSATDGREKITLRHLLQQTSGLDFEENYSKATDATNMLFRKADMAAYTAGHSLKETPGSEFYYSSGNSNILSGIIRTTLGDSAYHRYPYEQLFYKLGIYSAVMETDPAGNFVGSSYVFATARDWARLGLFYLQNGNWQGEQILPENWVQLATTPVSVAPQGEYGFQLWLNAGNPAGSANRKYPSLPADLYYFSGYEGQQVLIIPSRELVIVRLGQTANSRWFDTETFVNRILTALP